MRPLTTRLEELERQSGDDVKVVQYQIVYHGTDGSERLGQVVTVPATGHPLERKRALHIKRSYGINPT